MHVAMTQSWFDMRYLPRSISMLRPYIANNVSVHVSGILNVYLWVIPPNYLNFFSLFFCIVIALSYKQVIATLIWYIYFKALHLMTTKISVLPSHKQIPSKHKTLIQCWFDTGPDNGAECTFYNVQVTHWRETVLKINEQLCIYRN